MIKPVEMEGISFLFDLDGVVFDTEGQYTDLWMKIGQKYFNDRDLSLRIKGMTLVQIFDSYFPGNVSAQREIREMLSRFEKEMDYEYVPGVRSFLESLRQKDIRTAIVTSSDRPKMENVYRAHPEIRDLFSAIFTGEDFSRSKPAPDCYLMGMKTFGSAPENTYIFEDSFNGLTAARDSGGNVIALATTNPRNAVAPYAGLVTDDFTGLTPESVIESFHRK